MTDDQDPTGMSHLLAGLKETGPMPDDLNDRIRASLADEQAAAREDGSSSTAHDEESDNADPSAFWAEMDTDGRGPRRRSSTAGRWVLGIAAAAVVVMGIGGIFAIRDDGADDTAGNSATEAPTTADQQGSGTSESTPGNPAELPAFIVTESGTDYSRSALATEAGTLLQDPAAAEELSDDSVVGAMSTAAGAKDCLGRLGNPELQPVVIDVANFDGTPGVLLIAEPVPEGAPRAWAVTTGCEEIWPGPTELTED